MATYTIQLRDGLFPKTRIATSKREAQKIVAEMLGYRDLRRAARIKCDDGTIMYTHRNHLSEGITITKS